MIYAVPAEVAMEMPPYRIDTTLTSALKLKVPNPQEPLGCKRNPIPISDVSLLLSPQSYLYEDTSKFRGAVIAANRISLGPVSSDTWPSERLLRHQIAYRCRFGVRDKQEDGFTRCSVPGSAGDNPDSDNLAFAMVADKGTYTTPLGRDFEFLCASLLKEDEIGTCEVRYEVSPGIGLSYTFQPYASLPTKQLYIQSHRYIPLDGIIAFDRSIRHLFARYYVGLLTE